MAALANEDGQDECGPDEMSIGEDEYPAFGGEEQYSHEFESRWRFCVLLRAMGRLLHVKNKLNPTIPNTSRVMELETEACAEFERHQARTPPDDGALDETTESRHIH